MIMCDPATMTDEKSVLNQKATDQEPAGRNTQELDDPWENLGSVNRFNTLGYTGPSIEKQTRLH